MKPRGRGGRLHRAERGLGAPDAPPGRGLRAQAEAVGASNPQPVPRAGFRPSRFFVSFFLFLLFFRLSGWVGGGGGVSGCSLFLCLV